MLQISNLKVQVEETRILRGVDLEVPEKSITVVMGPNGSGKSTLSATVAGDPRYEVTGGTISFNNEDITAAAPEIRAKNGIFLAHQSPVAIEGVITETFLWQLYQLHHGQEMGVVEFQEWLTEQIVELKLDRDILKRSLNDDFSGGERKKMEIIQMLAIRPKLIILDEIDSGLDVDALKVIAKTIKNYMDESGASALVITHHNRLLDFLKPNSVHIMKRGKIEKSGDASLISEIESSGY